jgi:hypothetical protein
MATISDGFSARPFDLVLNVNETSTSSATNTSVVTWTLQLDPTGSFTSYSLIAADNSYSISIDGGTAITGNFTFDFRTSTTSTRTIASGTKTITHNSDGSKTIAIDADSSSVVLGVADCTPGSLVLTDFVLVPNAPSSAPTLSRSSDGATVTVTSATATSVPTITDYEYAYSTDGSNWLPSSTTGVSMGTDKIATFTGTSTETYFFRTRAKSSDGAGSWSSSSNVHGVPTAPATITATRTGRDVTVVAGASTGTGITGYSVQYSTNAGSSWSTAQAMTSQSHTYTSLTAGLDYLFRVYASNAIGNSAFTTSASLFVPAGGKRYDGTTFNSTTTAKRFDGTQWIDLTVAKRWNGSLWTDMS